MVHRDTTPKNINENYVAKLSKYDSNDPIPI